MSPSQHGVRHTPHHHRRWVTRVPVSSTKHTRTIGMRVCMRTYVCAPENTHVHITCTHTPLTLLYGFTCVTCAATPLKTMLSTSCSARAGFRSATHLRKFACVCVRVYVCVRVSACACCTTSPRPSHTTLCVLRTHICTCYSGRVHRYLEDIQREFHSAHGDSVGLQARPYAFIQFGERSFCSHC